MSDQPKCYVCGAPDGNGGSELRPYGPRGAWVCFNCATSPEREAETRRNFLAQLEACGSVVVIDGDIAGVRPMERGKQ